MNKKIAVLGSGHGGFAMVADLSMAGYEVNLYDLPEFSKNLTPIIEKGTIHLDAHRPSGEEITLPAGGKTGFVKINGIVSTNIKEVLTGVDLIMLVVPAFARERFVNEIAPYLRDGQILVVWPAYFGAIQTAKILKDRGIKKDIVICETESLIYACRKTSSTEVWVRNYKEKLLISTLPAKNIKIVLEELKKIYPGLIAAENSLETTLSNCNLVLHPQSFLLNMRRVEEKKVYPYYETLGGPFTRGYDITPSIAVVMDAVDNERLAIGEKFGLKLLSLRELLGKYYKASGKDLYETVMNCVSYQLQSGPTSLNHRYVTEDVPFGLVPVVLLGNQINLSVKTMRAIVEIGCTVKKIDYWKEGLTIEKLGLSNKTPKEILNEI